MSLKIALGADHSEFLVELPSGHHITVPGTEGGARLLLRLLVEQKKADFNEDLRQAEAAMQRKDALILHAWSIGTPLSPTQQEVEHTLHHKEHDEHCPWCRDKARQEARAPKRELTAEDLW